MSSPFVAEIRIFGFQFAPRGWAFCEGQLLPISQNTALFSLLGTTYGGNGQSNFALPNLQGSAPMQPGQGPGLSLRDLGETGGEQTVTLLDSEMPAHSHGTASANATGAGTQLSPANNIWANASTRRATVNMYAAGPGNSGMDPATLTVAGSSQPHNNMPPYLGLNFCIAMQGIFPPRT
ncbi:MAG: phage tail protein [Pyrinomonadaceae bacterium]